MRLFFIICLFNFCFARKYAYILTCGPGHELYATFGHTAIWIHDSINETDEVFNFGTFDFETQGFYLKFIQGKLPYALDCSDLNSFVQSYIIEKREIKAQLLNLDSAQVEYVYKNLKENLKEENRYYAYDFFFDNCSTRVRDLLEKIFNNNINWNNGFHDKKETFRQLLNPWVRHMPWTKLGFYVALGSVTDKIAQPRDKLFLPENFFHALENVTVLDKKLVKSTFFIFKPYETHNKTGYFIFSPDVVLIIFALVYFFLWFKKSTHCMILTKFFFIIISFLGLFIIFLWFFTNHQSTKLNFNILWANPLLLFFVNEKIPRIYKIVFLGIVFLSLSSFLMIAIWGIQEFNFAIFFLVFLEFILLFSTLKSIKTMNL